MNKDFLKASEYEFLHTNPHLGDNIVLLGLGGSHAYGTNIETSDVDLRGIATRTSFDICTGHDFEQVVNAGTDTTIYSLDKIFTLLAQCNPNCIEILGLRDEDYLYITDLGQQILDNKKLFLSKQCIKTFGGYANQQLYRLQQKTLAALTPMEYRLHIAKVIDGMKDHLYNSWGIDSIDAYLFNDELVVNMGELHNVSLDAFYGITNEIGNVIKEYTKVSKRNEKALAHEKISKHAMHLIRLYLMAYDLLTKGEIITYRAGEHELLMDIRNGKYEDENGMMTKEFFDILKEQEAKFEEAKKYDILPDKPDYTKIAKLQNNINQFIVVNDYYTR